MGTILELAEKWHSGQVRKYSGDPYVTHLKRVASLYEKHFPDDGIGFAVCLLHDILEDTPIGEDGLYDALRQIHTAPLDILRGVIHLTEKYTKEQFPNLNRKERKILERERLRTIPPQFKNVKICDLIDNCEDIVANDKDFARTYLQEKHNILLVFTDADPTLFGIANALIDRSMYEVC